MDVLYEINATPHMNGYTTIPSLPSGDDVGFIFRLLTGSNSFLPLTTPISHSGVDNYKIHCRKLHATKNKFIQLAREQRANKKDNQSKSPTNVPRKWVDPKYIAKTQRKLQQARSKHNTNKRKPKPKNRAVSHSSTTRNEDLSGIMINCFNLEADEADMLSQTAGSFSDYCFTHCLPYVDFNEILSRIKGCWHSAAFSKILNVFTRFVVMIESVRTCTTFKQAWSYIYLWLGDAEWHLLVLAASGLVDGVSRLANIFSPQILGALSHSGEDDQAISVASATAMNGNIKEEGFIPLDFLRSFVGNWDSLRNNQLFAHLREVIIAAMALKIIDVSSTSENTQRLFLTFFPVVKQRAFTAVDLTDSILRTVIVIGEGINKCIRDKDVLALFGVNRNFSHLEKRFRHLHRVYVTVRYNAAPFQKFGITSRDFIDMSTELTSDLEFYKTDLKGGFVTSQIGKFIRELHEMTAIVTSRYDATQVRPSPFTIGMYGKTSVGKSVLSPKLLHFIFGTNHIKVPDAHAIARVDLADKYESTIYPGTIGLIIDDVGNTVPDRNNGAAVTDRILRYVNNMPVTANKAAVEDKGTVPIEPHAVVLTSNLEDFAAQSYSVAPLSITRRCHVCLDVSVRPKFATVDGSLDVTKLPPNEDHPEAWFFTVYKFRVSPTATDLIDRVDNLVHRCSDGSIIDLTRMGWKNLFKYLRDVSRAHVANQKTTIIPDMELAKRYTCCKKCHLPSPSFCDCDKDIHGPPSITTEDEPQEAELTARTKPVAVSMSGNNESHWWDDVLSLPSWCSSSRVQSKPGQPSSDEMRVNADPDAAIRFFDSLFKKPFFVLADLFPDSKLVARIVTAIADFSISNYFPGTHNPIYYGATIAGATVVTCIGLPVIGIPVILLSVTAVGLNTSVAKYRKLRASVISFGHSVVGHRIFSYISRNMLNLTKWCSIAITGIFILSNIARRIRFHRKLAASHGNLSPKSPRDIAIRDSQENAWFKPVYINTRKVDGTLNMDVDHFISTVAANTFRVVFRQSGVRSSPKCHMLVIRGNIGLIPAHTLNDYVDGKAEVHYGTPGTTLSIITCYFSKDMAYNIPNTDLALICLNRIPQSKDIIKYFGSELLYQPCVGNLLSKDHLGNNVTWSCDVLEASETLHTNNMVCNEFPGYKSSLHRPNASYGGLCGAPLVAFKPQPSILGLHAGAYEPYFVKCLACHVTPDMLRSAIEELSKEGTVVIHAGWSDMPEQLYNVPLITSHSIHDSSPINFIKDDGEAEVSCACLGQGAHAMKYKSKCKETSIAHNIRDLFKFDKRWGGPHFSQQYVFNVNYMTFAARASVGLPCEHVSYAYQDYFQQVLRGIPKWSYTDVAPLNNVQNVNGIPGVRFIDALVMTTSVGYPLNKPKTTYILSADTNDITLIDYQHPRVLDKMFFEEVERCENLLDNNERIMSVFYASLKDEPTPVEKTKVRIFQAAPMALSLLVRKYFLPIARIFSCFPFVTECAVGISAESPEWHQWDAHVFRFGDDRVLAGDYSKYDLRMPSQLSSLALKIMIEISRNCDGYTARDRRIMNNLITELTFPIVHMNGDIILLCGSNPSGHNLTVYVNSIVNSMIVRCAFYASMSNRRRNTVPRFGKFVSLSTYGDDLISTVSNKIHGFCFKQMQQYLFSHGIKFTPPDKSERRNITFFHKADVDFLKRKTVLIPELFLNVGALATDSIMKSLCCLLVGDEDPETVIQFNVTQALRSFFYHGRHTFERAKENLIIVADIKGWDVSRLKLDRSFQDWVDEHLLKYRKEYLDLIDSQFNTSMSKNNRNPQGKHRPWVIELCAKYPLFRCTEDLPKDMYLARSYLHNVAAYDAASPVPLSL